MIATYVPAQLTPVSRDQAIRHMRAALVETTKANRSIALAVAKTALETGRWAKMRNWNWGNAKAGPKWPGQFTCFRCNEVIKGAVRWFSPEGETDEIGNLLLTFKELVPPGHPQTRFRAFAGPTDGAYWYVDLLKERFPQSWQALLGGDAESFVHALKSERYFTADEAPYLRAVDSMQREFLKVMNGQPSVPETPIDPELERLIALADSHLFDPIEDDRTPVA